MPDEAASAVADAPSNVQEPSGGRDVYHHKLGESDGPENSAGRDSESNGHKPAQPQVQRPRELSRYERTKRERAQFRAEREAFQREREAFTKERAAAEEAKKPKRDYS